MLDLFDYQERTLAALREGMRQGYRSQMLVAPTGGGKTEMAIALMEAVAMKGNRCAMILDRRVLCDQTSQRMDRYGIDHGVMMAGHWRFRPYEKIQVCSAQTLERRESFPGLKVLIVDEAHQTRKQTVEFIKNNPGVMVVGLSATPLTKGLGKVYENVISTVTTSDLVDLGRLVPLRVFVCKEIDMTGAKKVAGEWSQDDAAERGMKITGDIVTEWISKTHEVFGGPRKTVVFASGVEHGADLARKFGEQGYNFVALSYKDEDEFKQDAIKEFSRPDSSIHGLIATDILTKGFDVPDVMIGVSARPFSKSLSSHIQQMGRVMRCAEGKEFGLWLDHAGNYIRFMEDWEDVFSNGITKLDDGREKPKPEKSEKDKKEAKCPRCGCVWPPNSEMCPSCGHQRVRLNAVASVPGQMEELKSDKSVTKQDKQVFYSQMLWICRDKGYKEGWAANKYREKFGVWPKGLHGDSLMPTNETIKWVQSRQIAWSKGKAR